MTFRFEGQVVTLIDTPGFGDPEREDEDVLEHIAKYLAENHEKGLLLDGLILLHPANAIMLRTAEKDLMRSSRGFSAKTSMIESPLPQPCGTLFPAMRRREPSIRRTAESNPEVSGTPCAARAPLSSATTIRSPRQTPSFAS